MMIESSDQKIILESDQDLKTVLFDFFVLYRTKAVLFVLYKTR